MKEASRIILIIINIALGLTAMATWLSIPDSLQLNIGLTIVTLLLTVGLHFHQRKAIWHFFKSSRGKKFFSCLFSISLIFFILALFNYLAFKHPWQKDLTSEQLNSLSPKSQQIVSAIKGPLRFRVFSKRSEQGTIMPLLELYRFSKGDIEIELIDPDLQPEKVKSYQVERYGTVIAEYQGKMVAFLEHSEREITRHILKLLRKENPVVYYTQGHQEPNFASTGKNAGQNQQGLQGQQDQQGVTYLKSLIESEFYTLRPLILAQVQQIPEDADVLMIMGPKMTLMDQEIRVIEDYMQRGGRILVGLDPEISGHKQENLTRTFQQWGVKFNNDLAIDLKSHVNGSQFTIPLITHYDPQHPITKNFQEQTFFPLATTINPTALSAGEAKAGWQFYHLAQTNPFPSSWGEKNFNEVILKETHFTEGRDVKGPVSVMAAVEEKIPLSEKNKMRKRKIVAIGNSTFIQNSYASYRANFMLFLNALSWLVDEDFVIEQSGTTGTSKANTKKSEIFMLSTPQIGIIFYFSMIFCPIIFLGLTILVYRKRRW